jgi:hypothetical protein
MTKVSLFLHQRLCDHVFPSTTQAVGFATVLDGKGERDQFLVEQRICIRCGFTQERWTPDLSSLASNLLPEGLEG